MARMKLVETKITEIQLIERDVSKLGPGVLCRVKYNICNLGELNRNKRIYERAVWEKVLQDSDIKEKLEKRTLFAHAEHPEGMQSSTEKIAGIVSGVEIGEKNVYAIMEILDTPYGRICDSLLKAGCGLGTSTRAEGELEERIDEASGDRYYRVIPESYRFVTVDWTADPSTYGAFPESVERDLTSIVKSGLEAKKIDQQYATTLLEKMVCKEAVALRESLSEKKNKCSACGGEGLTLDKDDLCHECWQDKKDKETKESSASLVIDKTTTSGSAPTVSVKLDEKAKNLKEARKYFSDLPIEIGGKTLLADGYVDYSVDEQYGADADGNRGAPRTFIDDVIIDSVVDESGVPQAITDAVKDAVGVRVDEMDLSEKKKRLAEGTWSLPNNSSKAQALGSFLSDLSEGRITPLTNFLYAKLGDDEFFDEVETIVKPICKSLYAATTKALKRLGYEVVSSPRGVSIANKNGKRFDESIVNEQGGSRTTGLGEIWKSLDKAKDLIFGKEAKKKLEESKTIKEKEELILVEFKSALDKAAILEAEKAKLMELATEELKVVRENYATDVMDFTRRIKILHQEIHSVTESSKTKSNELVEEFKTNKAKLAEEVWAEFAEKFKVIEKSAIEATEKIYEKKFADLKSQVAKESKELAEHYNTKLMKLVATIKIREAALESDISPKHLALLEACKSEQEMDAKLNEIKMWLKENAFHSDDFRNDPTLVLPIHETVTEEVREGQASVNQTGHLLKSLK